MTSRLHSAWQDTTHASVFDYMASFPDYLLRKHFESFNEIRLMMGLIAGIERKDFLEVGCATGELYRYLKGTVRQLDYLGVDISEPAVRRAREKFGQERFVLLDASEPGRSLDGLKPRSIVFSRDVALHQEDPYAFLGRLLALARDILVVRLRTREVGDTVFDVERSCQFHYGGHWVPYIVLNTQELLRKLQEDKRVEKIYLSRRFEPLGGHNGRYLPKDLYLPETGTAESALLIKLGASSDAREPKVIVDDKPDGTRFSIFDRLVLRLARVWRRGR